MSIEDIKLDIIVADNLNKELPTANKAVDK
jgi:hypothetical protein